MPLPHRKLVVIKLTKRPTVSKPELMAAWPVNRANPVFTHSTPDMDNGHVHLHCCTPITAKIKQLPLSDMCQ